VVTVTEPTAPDRSRSAIWAAALGGLAVLFLVATLPLTLLSGQLGDGLVALVIGIPCAGVGVVVARRQPGNPLGWLFLAIALCLFVANDGGDYSYFVYRLGHHLPFGPAALALGQLWIPGLVLIVVVILLFPDGRLASRFWRRGLRAFCAVYVALLAALAAALAGALGAHPLRIDDTGGLVVMDNPAGWFEIAEHSILVVSLILSLGFICRQVLSWWRSSGEQRQQLKWLASGAAVTIVSLVLAAVFATSGTTTTLREWVDNFFWFGLAALPVSMGVAILRYRLYEIDRIISRTLAYTVVTGLLIAAYAGLVLLSTHVLALSSSVAVAASTLAAAAAFSPLRRRVQRIVDHRFNRARYDADVTVAAFAARLQDEVDLDSVRGDLAGVVTSTLEPAHLSLWLGERD
jgi:MFS family permease